MALKLTNGIAASPPIFTFYAAASSNSTIAGGANTRVVNSSTTVVGFVGFNGTLTFNNVDGGKKGGTKLLSFDYINGDYVFFNTGCSNCRDAFVSVNGGTPVHTQMPISAQVRFLFLFYSFDSLALNVNHLDCGGVPSLCRYSYSIHSRVFVCRPL